MISTLNIQTAFRGNTTILKESYCTTPFKIADITEGRKSKSVQLMLMSSSPGILDRDEYKINVGLDKNCSLELHTQSYQRLFNMKEGASQEMNIQLASGASFCFIPHPVVPHESSTSQSSSKIFMSNDCTLILGEILTCGRKGTGEVFLLSRFHSITEIFLHNKLVIKENILIEPLLIDINEIGQLEGFTHQASLIYLSESADIKNLTFLIKEELAIQNDIIFGISATPVTGLIVRILGRKGEQLYDCLKSIAGVLQVSNSFNTTAHAI